MSRYASINVRQRHRRDKDGVSFSLLIKQAYFMFELDRQSVVETGSNLLSVYGNQAGETHSQPSDRHPTPVAVAHSVYRSGEQSPVVNGRQEEGTSTGGLRQVQSMPGRCK